MKLPLASHKYCFVCVTMKQLQSRDDSRMKKLHIDWYSLVTADQDTCGRCGKNYFHLTHAIEALKKILIPKGIVPVLTTHSISEREFHSNRLHEHQLLIENHPIDDWIPQSARALVIPVICQEERCSHLNQQDRTYEAVSENLVIEACMRAAETLPDDVMRA